MSNTILKQIIVLGLISILIACGSQKDNFVANCSGKVIQYEEPSLQVSQIESRKYQFTANTLPGADCKFADHVIFLPGEGCQQSTYQESSGIR